MKLQRLRIEQVRQFRRPLDIAGFTPGINLFIGPNESGKSTLVRAIRAAFFERHRSNMVEDLRPWGDSSAAPQVALDFEHKGQLWRLTKSFLQRKRCDLTIDHQQLSGEEAEDALAAMLGFQFPGKGASKAQHWGIPGLLWIEQGTGHDLRDAVANAGDHLKSALSASLGAVSSSGGDEVINEVDALRGALLTKTGKPTGEYAEVRLKLTEQQVLLEALDEKIAVYQKQVDRLGELRQEQSRDEAQRPWDALRAQQRAAQELYAEVEQLSRQQLAEQEKLDGCQRNMGLLNSHLASVQAQANELALRQQARDQASEQLAQLRRQLDGMRTQRERANEAYLAARDNERQVREYVRSQALVRERDQLTRQLQLVDESLGKASQVQADLLALHHELALTRIVAKDLLELKKLARKHTELDIRQQSIATRLRVELEPGRSIELNGEPLQGIEERLLLSEAELKLPGLGRLRITPGGEDLGDLARQLERTKESFSALLKQMQVDSLEQAEQRAERYRTVESAIASNQTLLATYAPRGIEALQADQQAQQQRLVQLNEPLAGLPEAAQAAVCSPEEAERVLAQAAADLKAAEEAERQQQTHSVRAEEAFKSASDEHAKLQALLNDPLRQQQQQEHSQQLVEWRALETTLKSSLAQRAARIEQARPDILLQDIKRYGDSAGQAQAAYAGRRDELIRIQAQLESLEADGLEERRAQLASEVEGLNRRHDQLQRRADALSLLAELLAGKRQALTRRLQAPLQKHLNHYLQLLFSQASLEVDDNLLPGQLVRPGPNGSEAGDFEALSFGAREQMGLISRLAYADLLKESGRPTLIILDDALVHSDQQRLAQMKRILFDAGQRHQILLFSCHPENWRDLGVAARDIATLSAAMSDG